MSGFCCTLFSTPPILLGMKHSRECSNKKRKEARGVRVCLKPENRIPPPPPFLLCTTVCYSRNQIQLEKKSGYYSQGGIILENKSSLVIKANFSYRGVFWCSTVGCNKESWPKKQEEEEDSHKKYFFEAKVAKLARVLNVDKQFLFLIMQSTGTVSV